MSEQILFLGDTQSPLVDWLRKQGHAVIANSRKLEVNDTLLSFRDFTWLISYGYRYILPEEILTGFPGRAINLHISYLPWNRGADPNLWSFVDDTPKGVTIHEMDKGLDTGPILAQRLVAFDEDKTLTTSYVKLKQEIETLFIETWPALVKKELTAVPQVGAGSYHNKKDKEAVEYAMRDGWDTRVEDLIQGLERKMLY